ncbi:MAG: response regulator [Vicinamibacterales bacterium]
MTASHRVRIVIADDHAIFRDGLRRLLESEPDFEVAAEAVDGIQAADLTREQRPDVLLLDVAMPRVGGVEALSQMPLGEVRVILLTAFIEPSDLLRAMHLGVRGVVLKESATRTLIDAIRRVMDGRYVIGAGVADVLAEAVGQVGGQPAARRYGLTSRELAVVAAVASGESNREIADRLQISLQTVKHHLTSIFDKTGVSTRLELGLLAVRQGLAPPD